MWAKTRSFVPVRGHVLRGLPTSRACGAYYHGSAWFNRLWVGGYTFETPPRRRGSATKKP